VKIEINCFYSEDQLDLVHTELTEVKAQCTNVGHQKSLGAAIGLIDKLRTEMRARGGFKAL
jgi:hypothetical protein